MKTELLKYQTMSIITRLLVTVLSTVSGLVVVRYLTPGDYGLVGIVLAVAGIIGVFESFGLATGSVREISTAKTPEETSKVVLTSLTVRLTLTVPIAIALFFASDTIANVFYHAPRIAYPLKLFALILILDGTQDILASSLSGTHRFTMLFMYQIIGSIFSLGVTFVFLRMAGFDGYFYSRLFMGTAFFIALVVLNLILLRNNYAFPSRQEFSSIFQRIFNIGLTNYALKVLYIVWQRLGIIVAGLFMPMATIGYLNLAMYYGQKTTFLTDAIASVNLPIMSRKYDENRAEHERMFQSNFKITMYLLVFGVITLLFFSKEIVVLLAGEKYIPCFPLLPYFIISYILYSIINLLGVNIVLPALMLKESVIYYCVLCLVSAAAILVLVFMHLGALSVAIGMLLGALASIVTQLAFIRKRTGIKVIQPDMLFMVALTMALALAGYTVEQFALKIFLFATDIAVIALFAKKSAYFSKLHTLMRERGIV